MTAAQTAEFTKLRTLQKLLRYYEEQHGQVEGIHHLRLHVIEQMRRLAKLMRYGAAAVVLLLLIGPALAKDDGRYRNTDPGIKRSGVSFPEQEAERESGYHSRSDHRSGRGALLLHRPPRRRDRERRVIRAQFAHMCRARSR